LQMEKTGGDAVESYPVVSNRVQQKQWRNPYRRPVVVIFNANRV
jgi:hypothetical protein